MNNVVINNPIINNVISTGSFVNKVTATCSCVWPNITELAARRIKIYAHHI